MKQTTINKHYTNLCATLGDVEYKLEQLNARRHALLAELRHMDSLLPAMNEAEKAQEQQALQQAMAAARSGQSEKEA